MADKSISQLKPGGQAAVSFPSGLKAGGQAAVPVPSSMVKNNAGPSSSALQDLITKQLSTPQKPLAAPYSGPPMKDQPPYSGPVEKTLLQQMLEDLAANYTVSDGGYGNLISGLESRAPGDRAKLQALYDRYAQDIADQEAGVAQNYATAATNYGAAYDTTKANIQAAYDAAQQQQTQQMLALGLTGYAAPGELGAGGAKAIASQEALRAAVLAQNEAARKAAIVNNQLAVEGAKREGVGKVSSFDRQVADTLMQLQAKQAAAQQESAANYAKLRQDAYTNASKMSAQEAANQLKADIAALQYGPKASVDIYSLVKTIKQENPSLSDADAISLAEAQAKYSGR